MSRAKCGGVCTGLAESQRLGEWCRRWLPAWLDAQEKLPSVPVAVIRVPEACAGAGCLPGVLGFCLRGLHGATVAKTAADTATCSRRVALWG